MKAISITPNYSSADFPTWTDKIDYCLHHSTFISFLNLSETYALAKTSSKFNVAIKSLLPSILADKAVILHEKALKVLALECPVAEKRKQMEALFLAFLKELEVTPCLYSKLHEVLANPFVKPNFGFAKLKATLSDIHAKMKAPCEGYIDLTDLQLRALFFHLRDSLDNDSIAKTWINSLDTTILHENFLIYVQRKYKENLHGEMNISGEEIGSVDIKVPKLMPGVKKIKVTGDLSQVNFNKLKETGKTIDARQTHFCSLKKLVRWVRQKPHLWGIAHVIGTFVSLIFFNFSVLFNRPQVVSFLFVTGNLIGNYSVIAGLFFTVFVSFPIFGLLVALPILKIADKIFCTCFRYYTPPKIELIKA